MIAICKTIRTAGLRPAFYLLRGRHHISQTCIVAAAAMMFVSAAHGGEMVIGVAGPMTGPLAAAGKQYAAAVAYSAAQINKSGGLNGQRLRVVTADDRATPKQALAAARKLVEAKSAIVIGHYNSTPTIAANEIYRKHDVLLVAPQAIISRLTDLEAWNVVRLAPRADAQAKVAVDFLATRKPSAGAKPKIAIVHDNSPFPRLLAEKAESVLKARGIGIALEGEIPPGSRHTRSIIRRLSDRIATSRVDAIYWTGSSADAAQFLIALHQRKHAAGFVGTDVLASPVFARSNNPKALAGAYMTLRSASPANGNIDAMLELSGVKARGEQAAPALAARAAMQLVVAAARQTGSNEPRRLARHLRSGKRFQTVLGAMSFNAAGDRQEKLFQIYRWILAEDGKLIYQREKPRIE